MSEEQISELREIAKKNGVSASQLIRWAVEALLRQVEHNKGRLILPLDFSSDRKKGK